MCGIVDSHMGVPEDVIKLVKSFHEDMKATVTVDGELWRRLK